MNYAPPKGMRDFYPDDMRRRNRLFALWRDAARRHGFEEYDAPVVETEELLKRKSGEDILRQIYSFLDKSGRGLALRPEMTPSLARMVIARQNTLAFPLKWFSLPQCFRYERMTRGRKREHYQWNLDIIGEEGVIAEAEVLSTAISALVEAGLQAKDFQVRVGDRALLERLFDAAGIPTEQFGAVCLALDKREKINEEEIAALLEKEGLKSGDREKAFRLLGIKSLEEAEGLLEDDAPLKDIRNLFALMEYYGLREFLTFDLSIIRGLDYYTGIVFEAFDRPRKFRALFGGGRYDNLLSALGGNRIPCVGLGFGDVVICELLDHLGIDLRGEAGPDAFIGYMTMEEQVLAMCAARHLRKAGRSVDLKLSPQKPKKFFAAAAKAHARFALYAGPAEREAGLLVLKELATGSQKTAAPDRLHEWI